MSTKRVKKKGVSDVGKMIESAKDEFDLAFDKIKDLILIACSLKPWKDDVAILVYRKLILKTRKQKDITIKKDFISDHVRPFRKMLEAYHDRIIAEDLTWITESDIELVTGNSKKAKLPLTKIYEWCLKHNENRLSDIEANLYFIFLHLLDEKKEAPARQKLREICEQYQMEEDTSMKDSVNSMVNTVRKHMPAQNGEEPSIDQIGDIVKAIVGGGGGVDQMGGLAKGLLSGDLTIPDLIATVKENVEGTQQEETDDIPRIVDKGKEEANETD